MMKRLVTIILSALIILSFTACSVNENLPTECLSDIIEPPILPAMYIDSEVPQGATLSISRDDGRYALFTHPDYEITQEIFSADSWDAAFHHVSGRSTEELRPFLTDSFPHEAYRCTWVVAGERETELCQSLIFFDSNSFPIANSKYNSAAADQCSRQGDTGHKPAATV